MSSVAFSPSFLSGPKAFYSQTDYVESLQNWTPKTKYTVSLGTSTTEHKVWTLFKKFLRIIFFIPIALYRGLQALARLALVPTTTSVLDGDQKEITEYLKKNLSKNDPFKYHLFTVDVDGMKIDAALMGTEETLAKKRWVLRSNGNAEFYEYNFQHGHQMKEILTQFKSNALFFNYPKSSDCKGALTPETLGKVYRAMLTFLEDEQNGVGAKEIIGHGYSMGGAVQAEALKTHELKKNIKYVWIKDRTFSDLVKTANTLIFPPLGYLVKLLGWNIDTASSSKTLRTPEIILQRANDEKYIVHDGVITAKASLARALSQDSTHLKARKKIVGILEDHQQLFGMGGKNKKPSFNKNNGQVTSQLNYPNGALRMKNNEVINTSILPQIAKLVEESLANYPQDSHLNMKTLQPYIKKAQDKEQTLKEILEENSVKTEVTFFGTRKIRLEGAGAVSLKWLSNQIKTDNQELKTKLAQYRTETNGLLKKRNGFTKLCCKIQDKFQG